MAFQTDGNRSLEDQQSQLQALETFFVEVIDFRAGADVKNDVTTNDISQPVDAPLRLRIVENSEEFAEVAAEASAVVFDRFVFVNAERRRVIGFRDETPEEETED